VPLDARRVLDVGCGAGARARRLAARVDHVDVGVVDRHAAGAPLDPAVLHRSRDAVLVAISTRGVGDGTFPSAFPAQDAPVVHSLVMGFLRRVATGDELTAEDVRRQVRRFCWPVLGGR
jgi:hypothetical protein